MMNVEVKEMPAFHVAAIRHLGAYTQIGGAFGKLFEWAGPAGVLGPDTTTLGVYWDDPESTLEAELRSDACVTVPEGAVIEAEGVETQVIPGGKYAVYHTEIRNNEFGEAWNAIFCDWLPTSGYEYEPRVCYEIYLNNAMEDPENKWILDICVPGRRRLDSGRGFPSRRP